MNNHPNSGMLSFAAADRELPEDRITPCYCIKAWCKILRYNPKRTGKDHGRDTTNSGQC